MSDEEQARRIIAAIELSESDYEGKRTEEKIKNIIEAKEENPPEDPKKEIVHEEKKKRKRKKIVIDSESDSLEEELKIIASRKKKGGETELEFFIDAVREKYANCSSKRRLLKVLKEAYVSFR